MIKLILGDNLARFIFARLLNRGSMFVISEMQFLALIGENNTWKSDTFIDLGAGDGKVTEKISKYFKELYATEQSPTMQWRLQEKGYQ